VGLAIEGTLFRKYWTKKKTEEELSSNDCYITKEAATTAGIPTATSLQ
jgi:hypothetical protein